jgi:hypothetical protein
MYCSRKATIRPRSLFRFFPERSRRSLYRLWTSRLPIQRWLVFSKRRTSYAFGMIATSRSSTLNDVLFVRLGLFTHIILVFLRIAFHLKSKSSIGLRKQSKTPTSLKSPVAMIHLRHSRRAVKCSRFQCRILMKWMHGVRKGLQ